MTLENTVKLLKYILDEVTIVDNYSDLYQHLLSLDVLKTAGYKPNGNHSKNGSIVVGYLSAMENGGLTEDIKSILSGNYGYIHNFYLTATGDTLPMNINPWLESVSNSYYVLRTFLNDIKVLLYLNNEVEESSTIPEDIVGTLIRVLVTHLGQRLREIHNV